MTTFIVVLHVFVCLFLIVVILLQAGRGQGLSWGVFGGTPQSILGTKTTSFFARLTAACAIIFLITCVILNIIETRKSRSLLASPKATTKIDLEKLKEALKEAENKTKTSAAATTTPETGKAVEQKVAETPPTAQGDVKTQPITTDAQNTVAAPAAVENSQAQPKQ